MERPSLMRATRSPRPSPMCRSTKCAAALKRRGNSSYGSSMDLVRLHGTGGAPPVLVPRPKLHRVEVEARAAQLRAWLQHPDPERGRVIHVASVSAVCALGERLARDDG